MKRLTLVLFVVLFVGIPSTLANHILISGIGGGMIPPGSDSYTTGQDIPLVVDAPGVLENDALTGGTIVNQTVLNPGTEISEIGTITLNADGSFIFTPEPSYCENFAVTIFEQIAMEYDFLVEYEGGSTDAGTAWIIVAIPCYIDAVEDVYTLTGTSLVVEAPGVLSNDTNRDGVPMVAELINEPMVVTVGLVSNTIGTVPDLGIVELNPDGSFVYTPDPLALQTYCEETAGIPDLEEGQHDAFWYRAVVPNTVYGYITSAKIEVCGEDLFFAQDFEVETLEDQAVSFSLLDEVIFVPATATFSLTASVEDVPDVGTLSVGVDGTATYTPEPEWSGVVTIEYTLTDVSGLSDTGLIHIIVLPVNDAPVCDSVANTIIWPPNHQQVSITVSGITDIDSDEFQVDISSISSNQSENGIGDGNTEPDWSVEEGWVRAERAGNGGDRVYSVDFTADDLNWTGTFVDPDNYLEEDPTPIEEGDCSGNLTLTVPHDRGNNGVAGTNSNNGNAAANNPVNDPSMPNDTGGNNGLGNDNQHGNAQGEPQRNTGNGSGGNNGDAAANSPVNDPSMPNDTGGNNGLGNDNQHGNAQGEPQRGNNNNAEEAHQRGNSHGNGQ